MQTYMLEEFRISATGHSLNYLPEYLATKLGYFEAEELTVTATVPSPWTRVLDDLDCGSADAALGGIWVPSMYHRRGKEYKVWAQVSARCPLALIARASRAESLFDLSELSGRVVLVTGGNGASPFIYFRSVLDRAKVADSDMTFVHDLATPMLTELFTGGMGDYLLVDVLTAEKVASSGTGKIVYYFAESAGGVPWSVYYSPLQPDGSVDPRVQRFTRALARAMAWILSHEAIELGPILAGLFPATNADTLIRTLDRYRNWAMWDTPRIDPIAFESWQLAIARAGLIEAPLTYDEIIDSSVTSEY
jgi:NitT/TauT family transport system substrate-binding protein